MLRVTVEIVPFGDDKLIKELGKITIGNITPGKNLADYDIRLTTEQGGYSTSVINHNRDDGWVHLVKKTLIKLDRSKMVREMRAQHRY